MNAQQDSRYKITPRVDRDAVTVAARTIDPGRAIAVAAATISLGLALIACSPPPPGIVATDDGVRCGDSADATAVFVEITYDASGMSIVMPANCELRRGTRLTWRGPDRNHAAFQVRFKSASASSELRGSFGSTEHGGRQAIVARADSVPGRYEYAVRANGKELDPAIIIR